MSHAQSAEGAWEGLLKVSAGEIRLVLNVTRDDQGLPKATLDGGTRLLQVTAMTLVNGTLKFEVPQNGGSYEGKVSGDGTVISGTWTQRGTASPLEFRRLKDATFLKRAVTDGTSTYAYRVYLPPGFDAKKSYPVVLYLHGLGQAGDDNERQTLGGLGAAIRRNPTQFDSFIGVFPQIRENSVWVGNAVEGALKALDQTVAEFAADPKRLYLVGRSLGGFGSWYTVARAPGKFAAVAAISGGITPPGSRDAAAIRSLASPAVRALYEADDPYAAVAGKIGQTPAWIFHGDADQVVPVSESRKMAAAMKAAGGDVRYTEYPGGPHELPMVFTDPEFWAWLLAQRLPR